MLIAGNWKMHRTPAEATTLAHAVADAVRDAGAVRVAVCPPFVSLHGVGGALEGTAVRVGAQTMHDEDEGAFTGEVSAPMLKDVGCTYVILGHSERRQLFGETDEAVNRKVRQALRHGLVPIVCVGETLEQRDAGREESVVGGQLEAALADVELEDADALVVAYEPVWAIGTGRTASPEQAQAMHAFVRARLAERYGADLARGVHLLYGGSMKPANAAELLAQPDVDGGLVGGASLDADAFAAIVRAAQEA